MQRYKLALSILLFLSLSTFPLGAQNPARIAADLDTTPDPGPSGFSEALVFFDGSLYFWGSDPHSGAELRRNFGAAGATELLKDICPGRCDAQPARPEAAVLGDRFFFTACDSTRGCQLWRSDGSAAGTEIVEAFHIETAGTQFLPSDLTAWNGSLYFFADDPVLGVELWRSDGTPEGTAVVRDVRPGRDRAFTGQILPVEDTLFVVSGGELWTSDGTEAGTRLVATLPEGMHFSQESARTLGDVVFLPVLGTVVPTELWRSDGTAEGTFRLYEAEGHIPDLVPLGELALFFDATNEGISLVRTDGTVEGTSLVRTGLENHPEPVAFRGEIFFGGLRTLWRSDGTAAGTREVFRFDGAIHDLLVVDDTLFVETGSGIWKTAGTSATTERVLDDSFGRYEGLIPFGDDRVAVEVHRDDDGVELALVDEPSGTAVFLTDAFDPGSGDPKDLTARPGRLLLASGREVYAVPAGGFEHFELVASFPGDAEIVPAAGGVFIFGGGLWFLADGGRQPVELQRDRLERRLDAELAVTLGRELFFLVRDPDTLIHELYRSDGTPGGTRFAARGLPSLPFCIDLGCRRHSVEIEVLGSSILVVHDTVLARADLASGTFEALFDATAVPGCTGLTPDDGVAFCEVGNLTRAGGRVFFTNGGELEPVVLWTSDGTPEGTLAVRELHPAPSGFGFQEIRSPRELTAVGDRLFFVLQDPEHGEELWTSDGTEPGTRLVRDIRPGPFSSFPSHLAAFGGRLVLAADDGVLGSELWASDGTEEGTVPVADLLRGRGSSFPGPFTEIDGRLVFGAAGEGRGREPWLSDLTAAGTRRIADLDAGAGSSDPRDFEAAGRLVYMNADDGLRGAELFAFPRAVLEDPAAGCESCLLDGLFDVRVDWVDPNGVRGSGQAVRYDDRNLFFWFFGPKNLELLVKVLDGRAENNQYWVFYGALSDVEYTVTVENRWNGSLRTYHNPAGNFCGRGDTQAFTPDASRGGGAAARTPRVPVRGGGTPCGPGDGSLCLLDGRFRVEVEWTGPGGATGSGHAVPLTDASGVFWFFGPRNLELVVKALDGRDVNGHHWFFYGGLSDVGYTITVTDTESGEVRTYRNEPGELCGRGDTTAFSDG